MARWQRVMLWSLRQQKGLRAWVIRGVTFYFGYRILNHEVYETETAEPLLVVLGLWLCGIAPATFFDSLRKGAAAVQAELGKAAEATNVVDDPTPESSDSSSGMKTPTDGKADGASE